MGGGGGLLVLPAKLPPPVDVSLAVRGAVGLPEKCIDTPGDVSRVAGIASAGLMDALIGRDGLTVRHLLEEDIPQIIPSVVHRRPHFGNVHRDSALEGCVFRHGEVGVEFHSKLPHHKFCLQGLYAYFVQLYAIDI